MMDIYREEILEHYRHPRNYGKMRDADYRLKKSNISCGDEVTIYLKITGSGKGTKIEEIKFEGKGCALMIASASLLTEQLKGMELAKAGTISLEALFLRLGIEEGSAREKCVSLPLVAFRQLVATYQGESQERGARLIGEAIRTLRAGGVIIFPTDTVWGMGVSLENEEGINKFYRIKGRSENKPTAVLVNSIGMAKKYGVFKRESERLAENHWPGGLTIIVSAKPAVSRLIRGQGATVGLRVPDHSLARKLIEKLGAGMVTGSANFNGGKAPEKFSELEKTLLQKVDFYFSPGKGDSLTGMEAGGQQPSTVVETTGKPMRIIRQGPVMIFP